MRACNSIKRKVQRHVESANSTQLSTRLPRVLGVCLNDETAGGYIILGCVHVFPLRSVMKLHMQITNFKAQYNFFRVHEAVINNVLALYNRYSIIFMKKILNLRQ
jgi:hypothetical protein